MKKIINLFLKGFNLKLVSAYQTVNGLNYISAKETTKNAQEAGLSVCDYVESMWNQEGETQRIIDKLEKHGIFDEVNPAICEIGAGTGRYMEKFIAKCKPEQYESYETARDWANWLQKEYPIISQPCNGFSLSATNDNSINIIHAHGVFVYIPFFDSLRYFKEIDRVTKKNSIIIFDCITDDCLDDGLLERWVNSKYNYPRLLSEKYINKYFPAKKYELKGNFFTPYGQGKSKYFVFRRLS